MKKIIAVAVFLVLALVQTAFAQPRKMTVQSTPTLPVYSGASAENEITGNFGMVAGAINLGVNYVREKGDFGFGGYFFMQSSKDKNNSPVVSQVTAFGALLKIKLMENRSVKAYVAPGFGIAMVKDGSQSATGSKSDENIIGPTVKIGVQYRATPAFSIGLERMQFANWLNDSLNNYAGPAEYYSVAGTFEF